MQSRAKKWFTRVYFVLAVIVASYALSYYWHPDNPFNIRYHQLNNLGLYSHFIGAGLALLFGALQVLTYPGSRLHRWFGYTYCVSVIVGALGGCYLAFHSHLGLITGVGFFIADISWLSFIFLAIYHVGNGDIGSHREWMLRSMALTSAGISLRILLPLFAIFLPFDTSYIMVAWLSWIPNLVVMEIYLRKSRGRLAQRVFISHEFSIITTSSSVKTSTSKGM